MSSNNNQAGRSVSVSLGIFAWNEEKGITSMLEGLLQQSLFGEISKRGTVCEVICVTNGCTDRTAAVAERFLQEQNRKHPSAGSFTCRVVNILERGKLNAWNQFVHSL